ncbi:hypothetical protein ACFV4P_13080 [Kitasatospora sp. NPDC059795]|uniref:hypothetical protein n=1 Tax=Kitasatospora sp. NPDC059795 TaxID=3346949 RepID=UPI00366254AF
MERDEALEPLRRVLLERAPGGVAEAVEAARAALAGGVDCPGLWELGVLPEGDVLEARRLLDVIAQELAPALRLPAGRKAREWALARYWLRDLLDGRLDPAEAAARIGFGLRLADDPGSPLWPFYLWLHRAEDQREHCGGVSAELVAELHELAARLLAEPG